MNDDSQHLDNIGLRQKEHRRNTGLDDLLNELSGLLEPVEESIMQRFQAPERPVLFLVGNPRSGTTVFTQFLQSTQQFYIPSNVLSRFYYAPYIGAKIQQLLFDPAYDFRNELGGGVDTIATSSSLGKTSGPLAASEVLHFWRRFLPHYDPQYIAPDRHGEIDTAGIAAELAAIEDVFDKPLAVKGAFLTYNLAYLQKCASSSLIINLKRDPVFVAQSILLARESYYGRRDLWWSLKPGEYDFLKDMDPFHQIAGQVYFTRKSISQEMGQLSEEEGLTVEYEAFCADPATVHGEIVKKFKKLGCKLDATYHGTMELECSNKVRVSAKDFDGLHAAYTDFESGRIAFD